MYENQPCHPEFATCAQLCQEKKMCYFATAHMASRLVHTYCERNGGGYVHKSLPLELSGLQYACYF
jgi:hypothetical protein